MYLLIALAHAIPVLVVAAMGGSKVATGLTAAVMVAVGAFTGSPAYTAVDLVAVVVATWFGWKFLLSPNSRSKPTEPGRLGGWARGALSTVLSVAAVLAVVGLAIIGYNRYLGECADSKLVQFNMTSEQCYAAHIKKR